MKLSLNLNNIKNKEIWAERAVVWGLPTVMVPALRYMTDVDKPKRLRNELLLRDIGTYSVGAGIFLGITATLQRLTKINKLKAITAASAASSLWCGLLAPKLSKKLTKEKKLNIQG